jgi:hypothetical protein
MTPEQRAEAIAAKHRIEIERQRWTVNGMESCTIVSQEAISPEVRDELAAAIREAVEAEREACATMILDEQVDDLDTGNPEDKAYNMALRHAADAIRARGDA